VDGLQAVGRIVPEVTAGSHRLVAVLIRQPGRAPLRLLVGGSTVEVGRDCRGLLLTDPRISRRHLSLRQAAGAVRVTDLGSTNGTLVDGAPLRGSHILAPGEVVQLGASTIVLWSGTLARRASGGDAPATAVELVPTDPTADPPDYAALAAGAGTITLVCSDVERSSRRAAELGGDRWRTVLETRHAIFRRHVERHGGTELWALEDRLVHSFPNARGAVRGMVDVQRALHALARSRPGDSVRVRVGVHAGDAIVGDDGDLVGRPAAIAAWIANAARGGEILTSGTVRELVEPSGDLAFGPARMVALSGSRQHPVHPVQWAPPLAVPTNEHLSTGRAMS
jgi:class 3 adenylate cyclase